MNPFTTKVDAPPAQQAQPAQPAQNEQNAQNAPPVPPPLKKAVLVEGQGKNQPSTADKPWYQFWGGKRKRTLKKNRKQKQKKSRRMKRKSSRRRRTSKK